MNPIAFMIIVESGLILKFVFNVFFLMCRPFKFFMNCNDMVTNHFICKKNLDKHLLERKC